MEKWLRIFCVVCLIQTMILAPVFARENYSYTIVNDENYNASSPVGHFVQYPEGSAVIDAYGRHNYNNATFVHAEPLPYSVQRVDVPQHYEKHSATTHIYRDEREGIDKAIDRSGKIIGIAGLATLLGVGAAFLIHCF